MKKKTEWRRGFFFLTFLVRNHLLLHPVLKDNSGKVKWGLGDCNCCDCDFFTPQVTYSNFFLPLKSAVFKMELHKIFYSSHFTLLHLAGQQGWRFDCIIPALLKWRYPQFWLTTFAGFHCVGCFTWQRASVAGPQTDPTHTRSEQIFDSTLLWLLFWNIPQQSTVNLPLRLRLNTHTHTLRRFCTCMVPPEGMNEERSSWIDLFGVNYHATVVYFYKLLWLFWNWKPW